MGLSTFVYEFVSGWVNQKPLWSALECQLTDLCKWNMMIYLKEGTGQEAFPTFDGLRAHLMQIGGLTNIGLPKGSCGCTCSSPSSVWMNNRVNASASMKSLQNQTTLLRLYCTLSFLSCKRKDRESAREKEKTGMEPQLLKLVPVHVYWWTFESDGQKKFTNWNASCNVAISHPARLLFWKCSLLLH